MYCRDCEVWWDDYRVPCWLCGAPGEHHMFGVPRARETEPL